MFNPADHNLINAMVSYRMEQISKDTRSPEPTVAVVTIKPSRTAGMVGSIRQAVGLAIMRAGARLAGVGLQTRIGTQL